MKLNICPYCGEFVEVYVETQRIKVTAKGVDFEYDEQTGYCSKCHEEIYIPSINDANVDARYKAYWEAKKAMEEKE